MRGLSVPDTPEETISALPEGLIGYAARLAIELHHSSLL